MCKECKIICNIVIMLNLTVWRSGKVYISQIKRSIMTFKIGKHVSCELTVTLLVRSIRTPLVNVNWEFFTVTSVTVDNVQKAHGCVPD